MANVNAPFGLKPIGKLGSAVNSTGTTEYDILTGTTGTIYTGDPVKMVNTGGIAVAAAGDLLLGVFQGCHYTDSNGDKILSENYFQHADHFTRILAEKENLRLSKEKDNKNTIEVVSDNTKLTSDENKNQEKQILKT